MPEVIFIIVFIVFTVWIALAAKIPSCGLGIHRWSKWKDKYGPGSAFQYRTCITCGKNDEIFNSH